MTSVFPIQRPRHISAIPDSSVPDYSRFLGIGQSDFFFFFFFFLSPREEEEEEEECPPERSADTLPFLG